MSDLSSLTCYPLTPVHPYCYDWKNDGGGGGSVHGDGGVHGDDDDDDLMTQMMICVWKRIQMYYDDGASSQG